MPSFRENLGKRCQQLRKAGGLTQEQLAKRAGMDWKYLGSVERGERNITIDNVERIVKALGVEPYEPFLFDLKQARSGEKVDEEVIVNLVKHTDKSIRPLIINLVQSILRWKATKK